MTTRKFRSRKTALRVAFFLSTAVFVFYIFDVYSGIDDVPHESTPSVASSDPSLPDIKGVRRGKGKLRLQNTSPKLETKPPVEAFHSVKEPIRKEILPAAQPADFAEGWPMIACKTTQGDHTLTPT